MAIVGIKHQGQEIVGQFIRREVNDSVVLSNVRVVETTITDDGHYEFALTPYTIFDVTGEITFNICSDCDYFKTVPTTIETAYSTAIASSITLTPKTLAVLKESKSTLSKRLGGLL